jgi:hypothetical protein
MEMHSRHLSCVTESYRKNDNVAVIVVLSAYLERLFFSLMQVFLFRERDSLCVPMVFLAVFLLVVVILLLIGFGCKDALIKYLNESKAYANVACPPNKLPLLGNLLSLPISAYGRSTRLPEINQPHSTWIASAFTGRLRQYFEQSQNNELFCLWLGTYPILVFFHPKGLEVKADENTPFE